MHGGNEPTKAPKQNSRTAKRPKWPLTGRFVKPYLEALLKDVRCGLERLPSSGARDEAIGALDGVTPESGLESWALLRDRVKVLDPMLAQGIGAVCEWSHVEIMASAKTGADAIQMIHGACLGFVAADGEILESWRLHLRGTLERFEDGVRLDGMIKDRIVNMARFGSGIKDDEFAVVIQEVYAQHNHDGNYGAICDICEQILGFEGDDLRHARPREYIELAIMSLARHAIAQNVHDRCEIVDRCAEILKRRASAIKASISLPEGNGLTFQEIVDAAQSLAPGRRCQDSSLWASKYTTDYPPMHGEFSKRAFSLMGPIYSPVEKEWQGCVEFIMAIDALGESRSPNFTHLDEVLRKARKNLSFDKALQEYIIDMAKAGSGVDDGVTFRLLEYLCIEQGMHAEVCDMCEEMSEFEGVDRQHMDASTLIEFTVAELLYHMSQMRSPPEGVVDRCATLLEERSERLGLGRVLGHYRGDEKILQAQLLAADIAVRRRIRKKDEICEWISANYQLSDKFLSLNKLTGSMVDSKTMLTTHVSDLLGILDLAYVYKKNHIPNGALDELESLLKAMKKRKINSRPNSKDWKSDMRADELWDALLEMRIYVHCKIKAIAEGKDTVKDKDKTKLYVEPHPEINKKREADVRVDKCHIEVYSPQGSFPTATGRIVFQSIPNLCEKIMEKPQLEFLEGIESILAVRCDYYVFDMQRFRQLLEAEIQKNVRPGGIMLLWPRNGHYETHFIRNKSAAVRVKEESVDFLRSALGESI